MVDKNLFLYDLAVVAIMKAEEPYVKEWIDYHLLTGVDHFYIYDNDSTAEFKKVLQPYIDAGLVTYIFYPGKARQIEAYNDAIVRFRFESRYIAFIDGDEFIFPKSKSTITEIVDEIVLPNPNAAGIGIKCIFFGSNHQETADYTRGVLERFIRRASKHVRAIKSIIDPRRVEYIWSPHFPVYFHGYLQLESPTESLTVNHYNVKSREELELKRQRGDYSAFNRTDAKYRANQDFHNYNNDVVDNGILGYREARRVALISSGGGMKSFLLAKQADYSRVFKAVYENLKPVLNPNTPMEFFGDKLETFFTCMYLTFLYREKNLIRDEDVAFLLDAAINAIIKTFEAGFTIAEVELLISAIPEILSQPYPATEEFRVFCINLIHQCKRSLQLNIKQSKDLSLWKELSSLEYTLRMLKSFDAYKK